MRWTTADLRFLCFRPLFILQAEWGFSHIYFCLCGNCSGLPLLILSFVWQTFSLLRIVMGIFEFDVSMSMSVLILVIFNIKRV
uniref:Uncharacterized protein n=1 Tax=Aegilops tauschii subsp. strangulata TaxID=200361 RepID=A0A453NW89_AEGTS